MPLLSEAFFRERETAALRRAAEACLEAALNAVDAAHAVRRSVRRDGSRLQAAGDLYDLARFRRILIIGGGKAAAPMAAALEEILGDRVDGGVVGVKYGHTVSARRVRVLEAGHPMPDAAGVAAAREVIAVADAAGPDDLVFVVISGGGSALLISPVEGITLEDKLAVTWRLFYAGASIREFNTVRKHLSRIKGGQLATRIAPAKAITLALSDVLGNAFDVIASGPTVPDPTTYGEALGVLRTWGMLEDIPASVRRHLEAGAGGRIPETPKPGNPIFHGMTAVVIGDLGTALRAAEATAQRMGFNTRTLSSMVEGEARHVGAELGRQAREAHGGRYGPLPVCLLQGGEPTVTVRGIGRGGRNQEVALAAAIEIEDLPDTLVLSAGTDGTDGPTDAAGAVADGHTVRRARSLGLDPRDHLQRNDAYPFFAALGDLIMTGPTLTNVNDVMMAMVGRPDV